MQGDYVAIRKLGGHFSSYGDFALLPIAESDGAARFGRVVRKPLDVRGNVKCVAKD